MVVVVSYEVARAAEARPNELVLFINLMLDRFLAVLAIGWAYIEEVGILGNLALDVLPWHRFKRDAS